MKPHHVLATFAGREGFRRCDLCEMLQQTRIIRFFDLEILIEWMFGGF